MTTSHTVDGELAALQSGIGGEVLLPGSPGYDAARRPAVARFADVHPRAVVRCTGPDDVAATLAVARRAGLPVAVRGGGHCAAGRSSTTGILLDVSPMDAVQVRDGIATIGAGALLGAVYDGLAAHGLTLPAGCGPTVGIAGLTLGGGFGQLGRLHGLTCDRLLGARVVLADGRTVDCDAHREPDLFWALRGGGARGGWVVTDLRFAAVPAPGAAVFRLTWPAADAAPVLAAWPRWAPAAPPELTATLRLVAPADPGEPVRVLLEGTLVGAGDPEPLLAGFVASARAEPASAVLLPGSYRAAKRLLAGLGGADGPGVRNARSAFFRLPFPPEAAAALAASLVGTRLPGRGDVSAHEVSAHEVALTPWGGGYNRPAPTDTAFPHRREAYLVQIGAVGPAAARRVERLWSAVAPWATGGVYPNFPDPDRALPGQAYHGQNLARLRAVEARYAGG